MRGKKSRKLPWGKLIVVTLGAVAVFFLLTYKLGSLPGSGLSPAETRVALWSSSWHTILDNPLFLPITSLHHLVGLALPFSQNIEARLPSVIMAFLTFLMVIYILLRWYGQRTAILGCIALVASAWFLHVGRSGSFDIAYFMALPLLLTAHLALYYAEKRQRALWFWLVCMAYLLYVPGLVWVVLLNVIWQRAELKEALTSLRQWWQGPLMVILSLVLLAPLAYGFWRNPSWHYLLTWLGSATALPDWLDTLKAAGYSISFVFVRSPTDPSLWLGHLPVLDAFLSVMLIAGIYFYASHWRADRSKLLLALVLLTIILVAAGGSVTRSLLVPLLYLVAAGGIAFVLHLWLRIFPRNPLARGVGIALLGLALTLSCLYNLRLYFIVWPHNPDTKDIYSRQVEATTTKT